MVKKEQCIMILCIGLLLVFLPACFRREYVCPDGSIAVAKELCTTYGVSVQDYALTLDDLPADYFFDENENGIQLGNDITEDDLRRGWKEGYFCGFVKPNAEKTIIDGGVYCYISRYDADALVGFFDTNASANTTFFDAPPIGDSSVAYSLYDPETNVSSYKIEFVMGDVLAGVTVEQLGRVDMSKDVIMYAQIMASRVEKDNAGNTAG